MRKVCLVASVILLVLVLASCQARGTKGNLPPTIISFTAQPAGNLKVIYSWEIKDEDGDSMDCYLDFDGDGIDDKTITNCPSNGSYTYTFSEGGTYKSRLTVYDSKGEYSIKEVTVNVQ
jgi:hypothetical protein